MTAHPERPFRPAALPFWGGLFMFALVLVFAWRTDRYEYVSDDAGICLRYAERMAEGKGFNYNDGEAVNGTSNPLFVFVQSALLYLGASPYGTILIIGAVCQALAAGVLFATFARFYSLIAALFAALGFVTFDRLTIASYRGMETPMIYLLASLLFMAMHARSQIPTGLVLGAIVANKLDGALAAIAYTAIFLVSTRRFPWKAALTAFVTAAPVFVVLLLAFGSIIPNSMVIKVTEHSKGRSLDPFWMQTWLTGGPIKYLYFGAWGSMLWAIFARESRRSFPVLVIQAWFVIHLLVYATINLGDTYPWYASVPTILGLILTSFFVHALGCAIVDPARRGFALTWNPNKPPVRVWLVSALVIFGAGRIAIHHIRFSLSSSALAHGLPLSACSDVARQAAGAWLRKHTSGTEDFTSFLGLPAFEYGGPFYDHAWLNSKDDPQRMRSASYMLGTPVVPGGRVMAQWEGRGLVATFRFDDAAWTYPLYAKPESEIVTRRVRHLVLPTPTFHPRRADSGTTRTLAATGNSVFMAASGWAHFEIMAPEPPTFLFTPRLSYAADHTPASTDRVQLTVFVEGVEVGSIEIVGGAPAQPVRIVPPASGTGRYRFEMECRGSSATSDATFGVGLHDILLRIGEPLRAGDLGLTTDRINRRLEYVAASGMPHAGR